MDFNQKVKPTGDPSYLTSSKEPSRNDFRNESLGTLFDGIGNLVTQGTKVAYDSVTSNIQEDIWNSVDHRLEQQGVGVATDVAAADKQTGRPAPPALKDLEGRVQKLKAAVDAGALSNTDFEARLAADSRAIRQKYPGFREEVDNMMKNIAGIDPANSLRRSLLSDLLNNRSQAQKEEEDYKKLVKESLPYLDRDTVQKILSGVRVPENVIQYQVWDKTSRATEVAARRAELGMQADVGKLTADNIERTVTQELTNKVQVSINKFVESDGLKKLQEIVTTGRTLSPPEEEAMRVQFAEWKLSVENEVNNTFSTPWDKSGRTYASEMTADRAQKVKESLLAPVNQMEAWLTSKDYGPLAANIRFNSARQTAGIRELIDKNPVLETFTLLGAMGEGGKFLLNSQIIDPKSPLLSDAVKAAKDLVEARAATGKGASVSDTLKTLKETEAKNPETKGLTKAYLEGLFQKISDPKQDPQVRANMAKTVFNRNELHFLQKFSKAEQTDLLTRMAAPEVTQQIKATGDKKLWGDYQRWAVNSFFNVFRNEASTVKDSVNREWYDVNWDEKSNQFTVSVSQAGLRAAKEMGSVGMNPLNTIERSMSSNLQDQVEKINRGIKVIEPILKEDGMNVGKEMGNLLKHQGVMPGAKEESFFGKMRKAWDRAMTPMTQEDRNAENPLTFGGSPINFTKPQGGDSGAKLIGPERLKSVDSSLASVIQKASDELPDGYRVRIRSGKREGDPRNHGTGNALDVVLIDPNGNELNNYQDAKSFREYEKFAQIAKRIADKDHPEIADKFRWGGYFSGGKGKYGALDLMHFDVDHKGLGMGGGSWDTGLHPEQSKLWPGVQSLGAAEAQKAIARATKGGSGGGGGGGGDSIPHLKDLSESERQDFLDNWGVILPLGEEDKLAQYLKEGWEAVRQKPDLQSEESYLLKRKAPANDGPVIW